ELSSFALTVTAAFAVVEEVRMAVYVPSPLSVVAQSAVQLPAKVPPAVETVTVPPLEVRFVPPAFFSSTVTVEVELPFAVIDAGEGVTVDCDSEAGAVVVTERAEPSEATRLPALSCSLFEPGCVYCTVTASPPNTRLARVSSTCVEFSTDTVET